MLPMFNMIFSVTYYVELYIPIYFTFDVSSHQVKMSMFHTVHTTTSTFDGKILL